MDALEVIVYRWQRVISHTSSQLSVAYIQDREALSCVLHRLGPTCQVSAEESRYCTVQLDATLLLVADSNCYIVPRISRD